MKLRIFVILLLPSLISEKAVAQRPDDRSKIIVYGDNSGDWVLLVEQYAKLLETSEPPVIVAGDSKTQLSDNTTLIWFGDLMHRPAETEVLPTDIRNIVNSVGSEIEHIPNTASLGEVVMGINCFTQHTFNPDGSIEVFVNFSGDDPQEFCKGSTIANVLGRRSP